MPREDLCGINVKWIFLHSLWILKCSCQSTSWISVIYAAIIYHCSKTFNYVWTWKRSYVNLNNKALFFPLRKWILNTVSYFSLFAVRCISNNIEGIMLQYAALNNFKINIRSLNYKNSVPLCLPIDDSCELQCNKF